MIADFHAGVSGFYFLRRTFLCAYGKAIAHLTTLCLLVSNASAGTTIQPRLSARNYLLVAATLEDKILRFDAVTGEFVDDFVPPGAGGLDEPSGMAVGTDGALYVSNSQGGTILRFSGATGDFVDIFGSNARTPIGLTFGPQGDLFVASRDGKGVLRYDGTNGDYKGVFATTEAQVPGSGGLPILWWAWDLEFNNDGGLYLSSFERQRVLRFAAESGEYNGVFANMASQTMLPRASGLTFGPDGGLYVAGFANNNVVRFDGVTGAFSGVFAASPNSLDEITNVRFGPHDDLFATLANRGAVLRFDGATGEYLGEFTTGGQWTRAHFLLFTVPEPNSALLAVIGLGGFLGYQMHRSRMSRNGPMP